MSDEIRITEVGPKVEAVQHHVGNKPFPKHTPGEHLWIVTGMWRVNPDSYSQGKQVQLDTENLLNLAGPGCFWCEEDYSDALAARPCRGEG